jgi:ATP-dependent Lon protease
VTQKNAGDDDPAQEAIYEVGTLAGVLELVKMADGTLKVLVEGAQRARIFKYTECHEYYEAELIALGDIIGDRVEVEAFARSVATEFETYSKLSKRV